MKVDLYTLCWNEIKIIPFVIDYWKNIKEQVDEFHVYVYDNGSDDGSIEELRKYDWISVMHFESDGINELAYLNIKNNVWKQSRGKADYVIVCDLDECLYCNNFKELFKKLKEGKYTICLPVWLEMYAEEFPTKNDELLHKQVTKCYVKTLHPDKSLPESKAILFDPNEINEIDYIVGAHISYPQGNVKWYENDDLFILHYKHLSLDYVIWRYGICNERLSELNKQKGWGFHYAFKKEKIEKDFNDELAKCVNINDLLKK